MQLLNDTRPLLDLLDWILDRLDWLHNPTTASRPKNSLLDPQVQASRPKQQASRPTQQPLDPQAVFSTHKKSSRPTSSLLDPQAVFSTLFSTCFTTHFCTCFSTHKQPKLLDSQAAQASRLTLEIQNQPRTTSRFWEEYRTQGLQQVQITLVNQPRVKYKNLPRPNGIASSNLSSGLIEHRSGRILQLTTFPSSGHLKRGGDATGKERELGNRRGSFGKKNPSISIYFWKGEK